MKGVKLMLKVLQWVAPAVAVDKMYYFLSNPTVHKLRASEEEVLATATKSRTQFDGFELQKYEWGTGNSKKALLIHGWEGQAGNFAALIDTLLQKQYHIIAYDAPAHGKSSKGTTSMFQFGEFMALAVEQYEPKLVISHSFGSVTTAVALSENNVLPIEHWVMITSPYTFRKRVQYVAEILGVSDKIVNRLIARIEGETKQSIDELNMGTYCANLHQVQDVTLVHSESDRVLPIENSRKIKQAFGRGRLIELQDLGHYSILWSEELQAIIKNNVN